MKTIAAAAVLGVLLLAGCGSARASQPHVSQFTVQQVNQLTGNTAPGVQR